MNDEEIISRWRLVLGKRAEEHDLDLAGTEAMKADGLLDYLFGEDTDPSQPGKKRTGKADSREGGLGKGSPLTIPDWVDGVSELFPRAAKEVLEKELIQRRGINELLDQPDLLEKVEPNVELVKTLLTHKDLLNPKTRVLARKIIEQVVNELKDKMKVQVVQSITGAIRKDRHSPRKVFRNLDIGMTLRRNLKNWDTENERLLVDQLFFYAAERNKRPWHIIVAVDQSGSMLDSAIFSAIMASIFHQLPAVKTSMFLFDTQIADLTDQVGQPVDVLMSVQLGGGTDITMALQYAQQLVREPKRTILVTISDFYEGRDVRDLVDQTRVLANSGVRMVGIGALGYDARPDYCKSTAKKLRKVGMDILACTPEKLAECMGQIIGR